MSFAIFCDIDGVLVKERHVIKGAVEGLKSLLIKSDRFGVPIMFVTNGGNCTEDGRAESLSSLFKEIPDITPNRFVVSHSPLKTLDHLKHSKLLLIGQDDKIIHQIAEEYGWSSYETASLYSERHPYLFPQKQHSYKPDDLKMPVHIKDPVDAVIILSTPSEWHETLQLSCDALLPTDGKQTVELYAANPDFVYVNEYCTPRFTTGSFVTCLSALYKEFTGIDLNCNWVGKPYPATYEYAENRMKKEYPDVKTIYAIGDNPLSDIKGANQAKHRSDIEWYSILVRSGVHSSDDNHDEHPANHICDNIFHAIQHINERENFSTEK